MMQVLSWPLADGVAVWLHIIISSEKKRCALALWHWTGLNSKQERTPSALTKVTMKEMQL